MGEKGRVRLFDGRAFLADWRGVYSKGADIRGGEGGGVLIR